MTVTAHWRTPSVNAHDPRALPVRQVAYLRQVTGGPVETLITRQRHDANGRLIAQWDPRLFGVLPNLTTVYRLLGEPVKVDSVDAGGRVSLIGVAGEVRQHWDQRGNHRRTTYDNQLRVVAVEENAQPNVETLEYADASVDPAYNQRGQMIGHTDSSGLLELNSFSLHGQPLRDSRTISDVGTFHSSRRYSPLGMVLNQTNAGDHQQRFRYDLAGQLQQVELLLKHEATWQPILEDAQYNAAGQIIEQRAGNKVVTTWSYDPANGRLDTLTASVPGRPPLQHFQYVYDRVGNTIRIDDNTFKPVFFANQLIDGHREFTYNSLYQLTSATGHDAAPTSGIPGRPLPGDPNNHLNYTQEYSYDSGGNLIKLVHGRAVGGYTHQMRIDPTSNRGVRWKPGEPDPVFESLFDRHGNLQTVQPGRTLYWNSRDQLASATLIERAGDAPNDEETFRYSQGARVFKRHETHTSTTTHFHQVIYLPGLEIRTRDNGEVLHVIILPGGRGTVRCLHWVAGKPTDIEADQLRYSLDDHLGSSLMELDQHARVISREAYYPFGGTAWLAANSALEVSYKTIRYSGKEMDASGLYYYGLRYYAPWLQRWINPDPMGTVDGLNLYRMVGNNPINFVDEQGAVKTLPPSTSAQVTINLSSPTSSRRSSVASSTSQGPNTPALVNNPEVNPPGQLPPKPEQSWREWGKGMGLAAVNSKVGLALLPVTTSGPANAAIVSTVLTASAQLILHSTVFNPGWSPPGTWDPAGGGALPPADVTQDANRLFQTINVSVTLAGTVAGAILGPIVGGYIEEFRGTKANADKKAQAGKWMDKIDSLIAEQRLVDEVSVKAQSSLREQVLEVEDLIGITWQTMGMLEKITRLRPENINESNASSRRGSVSSQNSADTVFRRLGSNRTAVRKPNLR